MLSETVQPLYCLSWYMKGRTHFKPPLDLQSTAEAGAVWRRSSCGIVHAINTIPYLCSLSSGTRPGGGGGPTWRKPSLLSWWTTL